MFNCSEGQARPNCVWYQFAVINIGAARLLYTTTLHRLLYTTAAPIRATGRVTAGGQLPNADTKRASSCSFCDKIVVVHILQCPAPQPAIFIGSVFHYP